MPIPLEYRGTPGLNDMQAFNARTSVRWKGELLFRVYPFNGRLYFIKVGGAKQNVSAIHFGLIGAIVGHFAAKRAARKTQELLTNIAGTSPEELLAMDKLNHAIEIDRITEPAIQPRSFWSATRFGAWTFRNALGKKKTFTFDDAANFQAAVARLSEAFGDRVKMNAQWDDVKKKVVKVPV